MTQIQITITDDELARQLTSIIDRTQDLTPAFRDAGEYLLRRTRNRFDREVSPDGTKWNELSDATIKAKERRKRTGKPYRTFAKPTDILKDTFTLRDSITYKASSQSLAIGTNIFYGAFNQSTRPFLGLDLNDREEIVTIIKDYLS